MNLETSIVQPNEVVKAEDWTFGLDAQVTNIGVALSALMENKNNFIVGGEVTPYDGMNVSIAPIFGFCKDTMQCFLDTEKIEPVAIASSTGKSRVDIIEVKGEYEEFDEQQRKFMDFETSVETYQFVNTKKRFKVKINVKKGDDNNQTAPSVTDGWVKIAEIRISESTVEITEDDIFNVTTDISGTENTLWTNDKDSTYNVGYLTDVNARFRQAHNSDGSHKQESIKPKNIVIGTGSEQLNASILPIAKNISIPDENVSSNESLSTVIDKLAAKITSLYAAYMDKGEFNFNGELSLSDGIDENNKLQEPVKLKADGEGNAYIFVGNKQVIKFDNKGNVSLPSGYVATNDYDIVNKAVTNALNAEILSLKGNVSSLESNIKENKKYTNEVLCKYKTVTHITVATTSNIALSNSLTIDGYTPANGALVLVKDQTDKKQNGIYKVNTSGAWTRDSYSSANNLKNTLYRISNGTTNKNKIFIMPLEDITVNTDDIEFVESMLRVDGEADTIVLRNKDGKIESDILGTATTITSTLPIEKGGTGATTKKGAEYNLLELNEVTDAISDTSLFVGAYMTPSATQGALYKMKASLIWDYIKNKISSVLGLTATQYNGNAKTATTATTATNATNATKATQDSAGQQINTTYIKGLSISGKTITYTKGNGTTGTLTTQNTTYSGATSSTLGLVKYKITNSVTNKSDLTTLEITDSTIGVIYKITTSSSRGLSIKNSSSYPIHIIGWSNMIIEKGSTSNAQTYNGTIYICAEHIKVITNS